MLKSLKDCSESSLKIEGIHEYFTPGVVQVDNLLQEMSRMLTVLPQCMMI